MPLYLRSTRFAWFQKIFNAVDMTLALDKCFAMVDAVMDKTAHIQFAITAQAVCINDTVRHDFLLDNS